MRCGLPVPPSIEIGPNPRGREAGAGEAAPGDAPAVGGDGGPSPAAIPLRVGRTRRLDLVRRFGPPVHEDRGRGIARWRLDPVSPRDCSGPGATGSPAVAGPGPRVTRELVAVFDEAGRLRRWRVLRTV